MNIKMKRLLSILLCIAVLVGLMPTAAFAWTVPTLSGGKAEWNVQLSDTGVLTWNDMGGTSYDIEVDKTAMGVTLTKIYGINTNSYNLIERFKELKVENGTYYFTIKTNAGQEISSGDISFRYISPQAKLSAPQNLWWDGTVAKWGSVADATEYSVKLMSDSGYVQLSQTTTETQYDWSTYVADGYWFEVVATADNYRDSNVAEGTKYGNYTWTAPTLTGGNAAWNVTLSNDGVLRWNDMGSTSYDIEVDETDMGGTVTKIYGVNTNSYNLIDRLKVLKIENRIYYFTIKANGPGTNSGTIRFNYVSPEPKLPSPQNLYWDGTIAKWDSVANATEYTVKLYSDSGSLQLSKTTSDTQYDWSTNVYNDGFWFEVVATADGYRDSNAAEGPAYIAPCYSIGAYVYDDTLDVYDIGGRVTLTTNKGTDGWSDSGYIKEATQGTIVTLNAKPAAGYKFVEWRQGTGGATISTNANYVFKAVEHKYLYAIFVQSEGESVSCSTFAEFKAAMENPSVVTVTLNGTMENITNAGVPGNAIAVASSYGTKNLVLNGSAIFNQQIKGSGYENLIYVGSGITLNVSGSGSLSWNPSYASGSNSVFYLDGGMLHFMNDFSGFIISDDMFDGISGSVVYVESGNLVSESGTFYAYATNVSADGGVIDASSVTDKANTYITLIGGHYQYSGSGSGSFYVVLDGCDNLFANGITYSAGKGFGSNMDSEVSVLDFGGHIAWNPFGAQGDPNFVLAGLSEQGSIAFKYKYSPFYTNEMFYDAMQSYSFMEKNGNSWTEVKQGALSSNEETVTLESCAETTVKTYKLVTNYAYEFAEETTEFSIEREIRAQWKDLSYTGAGTKNDPVQVSTFQELRRALFDPDVEYVKVSSDIDCTLNYNSYSSQPGSDVYSKIVEYRQGQITADALYQYLTSVDVTDGNYGAGEYLVNRDLNCNALNLWGAKHLILEDDVNLDTDSFPWDSDDTGWKNGIELGNNLTISGGGTFSVNLTNPNFTKSAAAIFSDLGCTLTIEDAKIIADSKQGAGFAHAIYMESGSLVINDGEFRGVRNTTSNEYHSDFYTGAVYLGEDCALAKINGGVFTELELGASNTNSISGLMIHEDALSKITLNGGTFETGIMKTSGNYGSLLTDSEMWNILKTGAFYETEDKSINGVDYTTYTVTPSTVNFPPGAGTINNPVNVTNFDELKYALEDPDIQGIVVNSFENSPYQTFYTLEKGKDFKAGDLAITVPSGAVKYLTINADINIRVPYVDYLLYSFIGNYGDLTIGGTGSLNVSMNARGYPSAILYNSSNLEIGGSVTFDPTNKSFDSVHGYSVINNQGKTVINSGTFIGYDASAVMYLNGSMDIYGGTFKVKNGDEDAFGLNTDSHLTIEEHDVNLYGGTFEGIRADQSTGPDIVKLPDLLAYGAYYRYTSDGAKFNPSDKKDTHETLTVIMREIVDEVALTITSPKENETPSYAVGSASEYYGAARENGVAQSEFVRWYESANGTDGWTEMATTAQFRSGYYYKVYIDVMTMKGALFDIYDDGSSFHPNVTATVNGYYATARKLEMTDPSEYMRVEYNFGQVNDSVIENIIITDVVAPVAGEYPSYTCNLQGSGYHLATYKDKNYDAYWVNEKWPMINNGMGWWDVTNGDWHYGNKPFVFGHEYQVRVYIQTDDGYELYSKGNYYQSLVTAKVNGQTASLEKVNMAQYEQTVLYTFECEPKLVTAIEITGIDVPQAGKTPDFAAEVDLPEYYQLNPEYGIGGIEWYDDDMNEMGENDTFGEWDSYRLTIQLIPVKVGGEVACKFHDTRTTAKINDTDVKKKNGTWDEVSAAPKKVTIFYTFTKDAGTVKGEITSYKDDNADITAELIKSGEQTPAYTTVVSGNYSSYSITGVAAGTYTLRVSKANHVTREYEVTVIGTVAVAQDVKLHLIGDINGDGRVNISDVGMANAHAKKTSLLEGYSFDCANVNGDTKINISDVGMLNAHAKKTSILW